jgi:hypothetical protein
LNAITPSLMAKLLPRWIGRASRAHGADAPVIERARLRPRQKSRTDVADLTGDERLSSDHRRGVAVQDDD